MDNKQTCQELEQKIKQLEKEVHDCRGMEAALKDHVGYQSVLSVLRGVGPEETEEVLLQTFLSEIVKQYGFCMSWYGQYLDGKIRPILSAGRVDRYLDNLVLEIREPTSPDAQCAMSKAVLKAAPFTYTDLEKDEGFRQWRDYAIELGYRSNLALPLEVEGQVEGGVMVYADTPNAFPEERIQRLQLLTSELGVILRGRRMRERLDEALRKSERMYRTLVETSHDIIFVVDLKGNFLFTNKAFGSILGYSDKDREKVNGFDLVHPEDLDHVSKRFAGLIEGRKENNIEYRYRIKDGSYIHILTSASPVFDSQRKVISAFGIARDITELKRSQEALRENEAKYRNVVERSNDGIVIVQDGVIKYANPSLEKMTGYKADEAIDTPFTNYIDPDEVEESVDFYRRRMAGEKLPARYERGLRHKNGTRIVAEVDGGLIRYQDKPADLVIIRDITDRKQAEEALQKTHDELEMRVQERTAELAKANEKLKAEISVRKQAEEAARESEDKYKRLYDNAVVAMFRSAIEDGKALAVNDVGVHLYGYSSKEEFLSQFKGSEHYVDPDGRKGLLDALKEGPVDNFQVEFFRKDGSTFWAEFSAKMYLKEGYLEGAVIDITERKRAEKRLLEANEKLKAQTKSLEEMNAALKVVLERREKDKAELEEKIVSNTKELVLPYLATLKKTRLDTQQTALVGIIESDVKEIVSPFLRNLASKYFGLTPKEIQVAGLVKQGKTTKEIAELFNVSTRAVQFHRRNIREKLGLKNQRTNLAAHLLSLSLH